MSDFTWDPNTYLDVMAEEIPDYLDGSKVSLPQRVAEADPRTILDLGVGNGLTARRVAEALPQDTSTASTKVRSMLAGARKVLDHHRSTLSLGRLEDSLPNGSFDLVMSRFAGITSAGRGSSICSHGSHGSLFPGGRFVLVDLRRSTRSGRCDHADRRGHRHPQPAGRTTDSLSGRA